METRSNKVHLNNISGAADVLNDPITSSYGLATLTKRIVYKQKPSYGTETPMACMIMKAKVQLGRV